MFKRFSVTTKVLAISALLVTAAATNFLVSGRLASASQPTRVRVNLPKLPTAHDRNPKLYDKDGCKIVLPSQGGGRLCGPDLPVTQDEAPQSYRVLQGFSGPHFAPVVNSQSVAVLEETVGQSASGHWVARGLVRNERTTPVGGIIVKASLFNRDHKPLGTTSAPVAINHVRPGEPVPFTVVSEFDATEVARVEWQVTYSAADLSLSRQFMFMRFYELPYGERVVRDTARNDAPYPYVLASGIENLGRPVRGAELTVAWLDESGRVAWTETVPLLSGSGLNVDVTGPLIGQRDTADFQALTVYDEQIGSKLDLYSQMFWVVGK